MESNNKSYPLENRVAMISGGLGDIGRAIAQELVARGAHVALGDLLSPSKAASFIQELSQKKKRVDYYTQVDVSEFHAVDTWADTIEEVVGTADIIIPCAAQVTFAESRNITYEQWNRELEVNLNGSFYLARAGALRLLKSEKSGNIVFIGSFAGLIPQPHHIAYSVSKAAIHALTHGMALEFGPYGIKVNAVAPGNVYAGIAKKYYTDHPEHVAKDSSVIPLRQLVKAEEVAWHVANLCDPRNKNVTGVVLPIDGGMSSLPDFRTYRS